MQEITEQYPELWEVAHAAARQAGLQPTDCEDVASDTVAALWIGRGKCEVIDNIRAWVWRVAGRKATDIHRRRRKEREAIAQLAPFAPVLSGKAEFSPRCEARDRAALLMVPIPAAQALALWVETPAPEDERGDKDRRGAKGYLLEQVSGLTRGGDAAAFRAWAGAKGKKGKLLSLEDMPRLSSLLGWLLRVAPKALEFALAVAENAAVEAALRMEAADLNGDFPEAVAQADRLAGLAESGGALAFTDAARVFANAAQTAEDSADAHQYLTRAEALLTDAEKRRAGRGRAELTFQILYNRQIVARRRGDFRRAFALLSELERLPPKKSRTGSVKLQRAETLLHRFQSCGKHRPDLEEARAHLDVAVDLLGAERFNRRVAHARLCQARVLWELCRDDPVVLDLAVETTRQYQIFGCRRYVAAVVAEFGLPSED